jgi:hypothetical protein
LASTSSTRSETPIVRAREAIAFCLQRRNLRRTLPIAAVVGIILTLINQSSVILGGHATTATWIRCGLNFVVPFLVSNAGLLSGRNRSAGSDLAADEPGARGERERAAR